MIQIKSNKTVALAFAALGLAGAAFSAVNLPYTADFENPPFTSGNLPQQGWQTTSGTATIQSATVFDGTQALQTPVNASVSQTFTSTDNVVWVDGYRNGLQTATEPGINQFETGSAIIIFKDTGVLVLNGDGNGGGQWINTSVAPNGWYRVTLRLDFTAKSYDCYLNETLVAQDAGFLFDDSTTNQLNGFINSSGPNGASFIDNMYFSPLPPPVATDTLLNFLLGVGNRATDLENAIADRNNDTDVDVADVVSNVEIP